MHTQVMASSASQAKEKVKAKDARAQILSAVEM
jgi:hypothetical protein